MRYVSGIRNLFDIYIPISDAVLIIDNSETKHTLIVEKIINANLQVIDNLIVHQDNQIVRVKP